MVPTAVAQAPVGPYLPVTASTGHKTSNISSDVQSAYIERLSACEDPTGDPNIKILDVNGKYSYGVLQFQMGTWLNYGALGATEDNIYDPIMQKKVARHILDNGGWTNWYNCVLKTGPYPKTPQ